jgi:hypothetical protein
VQQGREDGVYELEITAHADRNDAKRCGHEETGRTNAEIEKQRVVAGFGQSINIGSERITPDAMCNGLEYSLPSWEWDSEFEDDGWIDAFDASGGRCWRDFPTQSPVCRRDDGFPGELDGITFPGWRREAIKASGNAIVPQVAYDFFNIIDKMNRL